MDLKFNNSLFKNRLTNAAVKPKLRLEFFDIIVKSCKNCDNIELNIPETLIKNNFTGNINLIFTTEEGALYCKKNAKPE
jgi:hypothetical protein